MVRKIWLGCTCILVCSFFIVCLQILAETKPAQPSLPEKSSAQPKQEEADLPPRTAEDWREALRLPVTLKLEDQSIRGAVEQICEMHQVPVSWDRLKQSVSNQEADFNMDLLDENTVTMKFDAVSGASALRRVLDTVKLCWSCEDWGVEIVGSDQHALNLTPRIYDVTDLMPKPSAPHHLDAPSPDEASPSKPEETKPQKNSSLRKVSDNSTGKAETQLANTKSIPIHGFCATCAGFGTGETDPSGLFATVEDHPLKQLKYLIMNQIGGVRNTNPWVELNKEGASCDVIQTSATTLLVIRQTERSHYEIENLLNELILFHHSREELEDGEVELEVRTKTAARQPIVVRNLPVRRVVRRK